MAESVVRHVMHCLNFLLLNGGFPVCLEYDFFPVLLSCTIYVCINNH